MRKIEITLRNASGLHARPASLLVKESNKFSSDIKITKGNTEYNAKSIMAILSMGASKGDKIVITANGDDAEIAINALSELVSKFNE